MADGWRVERLHCIVRPGPVGRWYVQRDVDHEPLGVLPQLEQGPDFLRIFFERSYTHAGVIQVSTDDDFGPYLSAHSNLGLNHATLRLYVDGMLIDPADVYRWTWVAPGSGNLWVSVTMLDRVVG